MNNKLFTLLTIEEQESVAGGFSLFLEYKQPTDPSLAGILAPLLPVVDPSNTGIIKLISL